MRLRFRPFVLAALLASGAALAAGAVYLRGGASRLPPGWPMRDVPAPVGLEPGFAARTRAPDGAAEALLCTGSSDETPERAMALLGAALEAGGWASAAPAAELPGASLWTRGGAVAFAHASRGTDGTTRWLLLRREAR